MIHFPKSVLSENQATRDAIFAGEVFLCSANRASQKLVKASIDLLQDEFGMKDIRRAHLQHDEASFFESIGKLRRVLYLESQYHDMLKDVLDSYGFDPYRCAFDPVRIRVVLPGGHQNPKAAPVYYPHRDTWYSHPQSLIVAWIPLHDLSAEETFEFYPEYFDQEVPNDSEIFDYNDWIKDGPALKIGWQKEDSGIIGGYPRAKEGHDPGPGLGFSPKAAETLLFAGSHFHESLKQDLGTIRYSLDFRVVHLDDVVNKNGAPNCDNRSKGNILKDYIHP